MRLTTKKHPETIIQRPQNDHISTFIVRVWHREHPLIATANKDAS